MQKFLSTLDPNMKKLQAMREGGQKLGDLTAALYDFVKVGVSPREVESEAQRLIRQAGGEPSFAKVPRYHWATCININEGVVHGIPESTVPFKSGDMVMVDVGIFYNGFHTDNAFTKVVGETSPEKVRFLQAGKEGLANAIAAVKPGAHIGELSQAMERAVTRHGFSPAKGLTGHGVGKTLHEEPMIPCLVDKPISRTPQLKVGQTIAIEIIYTQGSPDLQIEDDGWTIITRDGKLAAVFEETVEVTDDGHSILTVPALFQR